MRLQLHTLACHSDTILRLIQLLGELADSSLTSLHLKMIKTGARFARHAHAITIQLS